MKLIWLMLVALCLLTLSCAKAQPTVNITAGATGTISPVTSVTSSGLYIPYDASSNYSLYAHVTGAFGYRFIGVTDIDKYHADTWYDWYFEPARISKPYIDDEIHYASGRVDTGVPYHTRLIGKLGFGEGTEQYIIVLPNGRQATIAEIEKALEVR